MNFSLRATLANVTLFAVFLGGWMTFSGIYMGIASVVFLVLILLNVANAIADEENRSYWIGAAIVSCGVLLFTDYLRIIDAIVDMEDQKFVAKANPNAIYFTTPNMPVTWTTPVTSTTPSNSGFAPQVSPASSPIPNSLPAVTLDTSLPTSSTSPTPLRSIVVPSNANTSIPMLVNPAPAPRWSFTTIGLKMAFEDCSRRIWFVR